MIIYNELAKRMDVVQNINQTSIPDFFEQHNNSLPVLR
jgi:hypothetical protein